MMTEHRFRRLAWTALSVNLVVIVWGALVRASGSGAGCGGSWPACEGGFLPSTPGMQQVIEYTHRLTSGLALLLGIAVAWGAFRAFPRGRAVRKWAVASLAFMVVEALLGASLVIFGFVGANATPERLVTVSIHLLNTFFLLGSFAMTAWSAGLDAPVRLRREAKALGFAAVGAILLLALGVTGSLTALGHTLSVAGVSAPARDFLAGIRMFHPALALGVTAYLAFAAPTLASIAQTPKAKKLVGVVGGHVIAQVFVGTLNFMFGSPLWAQLLHLLLADGVWLTFLILAAHAVTVREERETVPVETGNRRVAFVVTGRSDQL